MLLKADASIASTAWPTKITARLNSVFVFTITRMGITFDPAKREKALLERGLDFAEFFGMRTANEREKLRIAAFLDI